MTWQGTTEHEALHSVATSLVAGLRDLESWLLHGDTEYIFHSDSAARCRSLGTYIGSALADAERDAYAPALAPSIQEYFDDGLSETDERREYAERNKFMYEVYLKWSSIKESLKANGFAEEETLRRLDVHYRFLSAFVHPNTDVTKLLYGRNAWNWPMYDHYSSELILLYAIVFAVEELRNFRAMAQRQPFAEVNNWIETERLCDRAWRLSSHLWFPGQEPHAHDRYQEANHRGFREQRSGSVRRLENPAALPVEEVGYYVNPLERLVELHASKREMMTGLSYVSSWPRSDAHLR